MRGCCNIKHHQAVYLHPKSPGRICMQGDQLESFFSLAAVTAHKLGGGALGAV